MKNFGAPEAATVAPDMEPSATSRRGMRKPFKRVGEMAYHCLTCELSGTRPGTCNDCIDSGRYEAAERGPPTDEGPGQPMSAGRPGPSD
jgi:hypothetical protein